MANQKWLEAFNKYMLPNQFPEMITNVLDKGLFYNWERTIAPAMSDWYLDCAIRVACGDYQHEYVRLFLDWSIAHSERALADPRFDIESNDQKVGWKTEWYFQRHSETLMLFTLATAIRDNAAIDTMRYNQAADELHTHVLNESKYNWESMEQSWYLNVIHMKLIIGDVAGARALFKTRKKFKFVQRHYDLLHAFVFAISDDDQRITDESVTRDFTAYFDVARDPDYQFPHERERDGNAFYGSMPPIRLDLALLIHKYICGQEIAGHWPQIIGSISA